MEEFVKYLKCPKTGEPLTLRVTEAREGRVLAGSLSSSAATYPIVRGIPRFVTPDANYADSFGYQWGKWKRVQFESENRGSSMAGHTTAMFDRIVMQSPETLAAGVVADVGCGAGRFIDVLRAKGHCKVIGIDYSSAVEVAAENFRNDPNVLIVQADALNMPIRDRALDGVYSIGVLHHTPDPRRGLHEMVAATRPGGWVALCVYGKGAFYDDPRIVAYRRLFKRLFPLFGNRTALWYANFAGRVAYPLTRLTLIGPLVRLLIPMARLPDVRWRVLDTFDAVTPTYQSTHESYEVFRWFKEEGLVDIEPSDWGFSAYHGRTSSSQ